MYHRSMIFGLRRKWGFSTWTVPSSMDLSDPYWWRVVVIGPVVFQYLYRGKPNF